MALAPALGEPHAQALAALGAVVSRVAHETRNILGGVELSAALLVDHCAGRPELAPISARVLTGLRQLGAVAGNLLQVARRGEQACRPVDLATLVAEIAASAELAALDAGIRVRLRRDGDAAWVLGDADRLRQALLNAVLNAVHAMPRGGTLTVALRARRHELEIRISDTGVGMSPAVLARATEPFFTTRPSGTGLGLAIVRETASAHGAALALRSRVGRGTTVRLRFPRALAPTRRSSRKETRA